MYSKYLDRYTPELTIEQQKITDKKYLEVEDKEFDLLETLKGDRHNTDEEEEEQEKGKKKKKKGAATEKALAEGGEGSRKERKGSKIFDARSMEMKEGEVAKVDAEGTNQEAKVIKEESGEKSNDDKTPQNE